MAEQSGCSCCCSTKTENTQDQKQEDKACQIAEELKKEQIEAVEASTVEGE